MTKLTKAQIRNFSSWSTTHLQFLFDTIGDHATNRVQSGPRKGQLLLSAIKRSDLYLAEISRRRAAEEARAESQLQDRYSEAELVVIRQRCESIRDYSIPMAVTDDIDRVDGDGKITAGDLKRRFGTRDLGHVSIYKLDAIWLNHAARKGGQ